MFGIRTYPRKRVHELAEVNLPPRSTCARAKSSAGPWPGHLRAELVINALQQALGSCRTLPGLIFHSDRGSQDGSGTFRELLRAAGMRQSRSARANPYHNACAESFIGTLKTEMLADGSFIAHADARIELFASIESYYNTHRKHSSLGYKTPASFEAHINSNH